MLTVSSSKPPVKADQQNSPCWKNNLLKRETSIHIHKQVFMNVLTATEKAFVIIFFSDLQMYQYYIQVSFLCECVINKFGIINGSSRKLNIWNIYFSNDSADSTNNN